MHRETIKRYRTMTQEKKPNAMTRPSKKNCTDAFIDMACRWLEDNLYDYAGEDKKRNIVSCDNAIYLRASNKQRRIKL